VYTDWLHCFACTTVFGRACSNLCVLIGYRVNAFKSFMSYLRVICYFSHGCCGNLKFQIHFHCPNFGPKIICCEINYMKKVADVLIILLCQYDKLFKISKIIILKNILCMSFDLVYIEARMLYCIACTHHKLVK
jgi:hypothetical protein